MGIGLSSGKQSSKSSGTQTMTPQAPTWVSTPWQDVSEKAKGLLDPVALPSTSLGASALQKTAFSNANSLGLLKDVDLSPYLNPYISSVVDASTNDLDVARKRALVGNSAASAAAGAGAWAGDRAGVADSLTNEGFLGQVASMSAQLRQAAYENAQRAAQGDIENQRANATLQGQLGAQEKDLSTESDPYTQYLKRLADYAAMIGKIPAELFTGKVTNADSSGSGSSYGVDASFSSKYGFQ